MSVVDALQEALAAEHALVYAYGVLGARTSQSAAPDLHAQLLDTYREHRSRRDSLHAYVVEAGGTPVAAEPAYAVPDWTTPADVADAASTLEASSAESMAALVAGTSGSLRGWALEATVRSSSRVVLLGGTASTWPGATELSS